MIKHHNYFKVHLPKKDYKGKDKGELTEILMEEFHLYSNGNWTKDYKSINPKEDKFEISLYPSIVYATNQLNYSENEKFQSINNFIDNSFVDFLERFNPLYKCTSFIEYHLYYYKGDANDFYKHIKYQILSIIKKRKKNDTKNDFDYENLELILNDWIKTKMEIEKDNKFETNIKNVKNVIVNNDSKGNSKISNKKNKPLKDKIEFYSIIIAVVGILVSIIIGWKEIIDFIN